MERVRATAVPLLHLRLQQKRRAQMADLMGALLPYPSRGKLHGRVTVVQTGAPTWNCSTISHFDGSE